MNRKCYHVTGINNTQMKTSLKNALDKIEGVQSVGVDRVKSTVEVKYNPPAYEQSIKNCIEDTGFTVS